MGIFRKTCYTILNMKYRRNIEGKGYIHYKPWLTHFIIRKSAHINLKDRLIIGENSYGNNKRSNLIRLDEDAVLEVKGKFMFMYGADVIVFKGGHLVLGENSFINSDCKIRCHKNISIGNDCAISHDFIIMDSDAHFLNGDNRTKDVIIEDNVWIGTRVTVLSGTRIGTGSVVAAGSVVNIDIPPHSLAAGVPARVIRTDIKWSK